MDRRLFLFGLVPLAVGCAPPARLVLMPAPQSDLSVRPIIGSLMVRDVDLPSYAGSVEVVFLDEAGILQSTGLLWADAPDRAIRFGLVEALGAITGARVAAEPWPFSQRPAAELTVRVSLLTARPGGTLDLAGHYAIAPVASDLADRSGRFDISVPVAAEEAASIGAAQSAAIAALAETIAERLSR